MRPTPFTFGGAFISTLRNIPSFFQFPSKCIYSTMPKTLISRQLFHSGTVVPYRRHHRPPTFVDIGTRLRHYNNDSSTKIRSDSFSSSSVEKIKREVFILDEQTSRPDFTSLIPHFSRCVEHVRDILGYPHYEVVLALVDDEEIRELNKEYLGKDAPTDILSFPFDDDVVLSPGVLGEPEFDLDDYYNLGDMMISVPYVSRRAKEDMRDLADGTLMDDEDDRGVSKIMSTMKTVEERIPALVVHGMLHLVGYDHIEDNDYEIMVSKEEEVWRELQKRLKSDRKRV